MPLLKLWNSICGRRVPTAEQPPAGVVESTAGLPQEKPNLKSKGPRLTLFGGGGGHSALCKLVKPLQAKTVLEIGVGDGSQAIALLQALGNSTQTRYIAIDQFEMAGGEVTLKAFHQSLRAAGIRPQVYPGPIDRGLDRVGNTIGVIDLCVIAVDVVRWQTPETLSLLRRICTPQTVIFYQDDESWERFTMPPAGPVRRAA